MTTLALSLFPGIGLLDMAFEQEGFCVVRGPDVIWGGDIRKFTPPLGKFDGVIGGPPCQAFSSLAHLVRANGHEPKFGNLIPEFERCVAEARPHWFLMENVPAAPEPVVKGYSVTSFLLDNSMLDSGDGWGEEQRRVRRFSFGLATGMAPDLRRWIDMAVFVLPDAELSVTASHDSRENLNKWSKTRKHAVLSVPVKIGGSGKIKRTRQVTVTSTDGGIRPSERQRVKAVSGSNGGNGSERNTPGAGNNGKGRYRLADALRLQGLPEDFLDHCPFTAEGKLKAVANGVALPTGRAIAKAVKEAILQ